MQARATIGLYFALGFSVLGVSYLGGQQLDCVPANACDQQLPANTTIHSFTLQLHTGALNHSGATISYNASHGHVLHPSPTAANGQTTLTWRGTLPASGQVTISTWATVAGRPAIRHVTLKRQNAASVLLDPSTRSGLNQKWTRGSFLGEPLTVQVVGPAGPVECADARVAFDPTGDGVATPDTASGAWEPGVPNGTCIVSTRWRLADFVGQQYLSARAIGSTSRVQFDAISRGKPRIASGISVNTDWIDDDATVRTVKPTVAKVERNITSADGTFLGTITADSTISADTTLTAAERPKADPLVGIEFTVFPNWEVTRYLRFVAALSMHKPTERFYFGISVPQIWEKERNEASAIGFHVGAFGNRVKVLNGEGDEKTRTLWSFPSFMVLVDGSSLLSNLLGAFK